MHLQELPKVTLWSKVPQTWVQVTLWTPGPDPMAAQGAGISLDSKQRLEGTWLPWFEGTR
jgi:hypothetical protein